MHIDQLIMNFFMSARTPLGVKFFSAITWLGECRVLIFAAIVFTLFFWIKNKREFILPFLIAIGGAEISGQVIKILIQRPRPLGGLETESTFSFPSGHALISAAFFGFLIYYFWQNSRRRARKVAFLIFGIILILLIGVSRLYLGAHYVSDVVAGCLLGFIWLWIGVKYKEICAKGNNNILK